MLSFREKETETEIDKEGGNIHVPTILLHNEAFIWNQVILEILYPQGYSCSVQYRRL